MIRPHKTLRFAIAWALVLGHWALGPVAAGAPKPNIVYILADDLGYGDLGSYGQTKIRTPRLDRMAREGMRFTDHYTGAPLCAPARCVLMTGLHTGHARIRANRNVPLRPEDTTIFEVLKRAGYATGAFGKWSLGLHDTTGAPWRKGVDEFMGYVNQTAAHHYYPEHIDHNDTKLVLPGNTDGGRTTYSHDVIADGALQFLYVPFCIPHAEVLAPEDSVKEYRGRWEETPFPGRGNYAAQAEPRAVRAAMITRMDRDVGRILDLLDELKLAENTLVLFTSDNGPITAGGQDPEFFNSAGPLRDLKFTLWEGGIRVPFLARWPGKVAPGTTSGLPSAFWDMFPTFTELAGVPAPKGLDGVSILPTLLGEPAKQKRHEHLYWEYNGAQAVRMGKWKALRPAVDRPVQLYDLAADIGETRNVASAHADVVARIGRIMEEARVDSEEFPLVKEGKQKSR
jgi:arylsulfatase A